MKTIPTHYFSLFALMCLAVVGLSGCTTVVPEELAPVVASPVEEAVEPILPEETAEPVALPEETVEPTEPVVKKPSAYNGDDVLWIQQRLQEQGYYTGDIDGAVGAATRAAIKAYQADQSIPADGNPTSRLREFMWRNGG